MSSASTKRYVGIIFFDVVVTLFILSLVNYNGFWTWGISQIPGSISGSHILYQNLSPSSSSSSARILISTPTVNLSEDFLFGKEYYHIYHKNGTDSGHVDLLQGKFTLQLSDDSDPSNGWNIDWKYLKSILSTDTKYLVKNKISIDQPTPILNINQLDKEKLENSIKWHSPNYEGYCRPYFYPMIAGAHWEHENGLERVVNTLSDLRNDNDKNIRYKTDDDIVDLLNYQVNNNDNRLRPWVHHIFDFYNSSNKEWNYKTSLLKVKHAVGRRGSAETPEKVQRTLDNAHRSDHERVQYMRDLRTSYRYDSLVLTHNPKQDRYNIEIIVSTNRPQAYEWNLHYKEDIPCNLDIEGVKRWSGEWDPQKNDFWHPETEKIDSGMEDNRFLCVFSNGITVLSNKVRRANDIKFFMSHYVIECDITDHPSILKPLLNNQHSTIDTNIGLSLFSLLYKETDKQLYNEYLIAMNVQLPVCSIMEINRRKSGIYNNSLEYHAISSNQFHRIQPHTVKSNINGSALTNNNLFENVQVEGVKHNLAAMTMIHPSLRSGDMDILVQQWIDYHLFQGFNHFYLYDHLMNRNEENIRYFDIVLEPYISAKIVTLFEWPHIVREWEHRDYEVSAYNDGIRRFRYDTKLLTLHDVDEFITVLPTYIPEFQYDWSQIPNVATLMAQSNQNFGSQVLLAYQGVTDFYAFTHAEEDNNKNTNNNNTNITTDTIEIDTYPEQFYNEKLGCNANDNKHRFDSYIQRHSCIVKSIDNEELIEEYFEEYKTDNSSREYNKNLWDFTIYDKLDVIRRGMDKFEVIKERKRLQNDFGKWLHAKDTLVNLDKINDNSRTDKERKDYKQMLYFDYLNEDQWWLGFSLTPKVMVNPMLAYLGFQHDMSLYNTHALLDEKYFEDKNVRDKYINKTKERQQYKQKKYHGVKEMIDGRHDDESGNLISDILTDNWDPLTWTEANDNEYEYLGRKWNIGLLHVSDHWRTLGFYYRQNKFIDFKNKEDMTIFYNIIKSKCDRQNELLFVNSQFLMSQFGNGWNEKKRISPLFDQYGRFCYDLNQSYSQVWRDENGR